MRFISSLLLVPSLLGISCQAIPYEEYILAPASRNVFPASVYQANGSVSNADVLTRSGSGNTTLRGVSSITYDFGKNIGGIVSLDIGSASSRDAFVGVAFTESSLWISNQACDATSDAGYDTPLWFPVGKGPGRYTAEKKHTRGGFRYLTLISNTTATVSVRSLQVNYTAAPTQDLRAYTGYFHSNDELINRIWYAGAYTNQLCTIDPTTGDALPLLGAINSGDNITLPQTDPWWNNYTITNGSSTITDGAKRDRLVWPGDLSIALESIVVSTSDFYSLDNAIQTMFAQQAADGRLPYASKPFTDTVSFTYHLHSLVGVSYYYRYSGDQDWLSSYWSQYKKGLEWALSSVDSTGLANITASADWLRFGMGAHNIEANAILYFVLNEAQELAEILEDSDVSANWAKIAAGIKSAANERLWEKDAGLYRDNETTTLYPQDGNSWAIKANLTLSEEQSSVVSSALQARWGPYGPPAPEAGKTVSPFISGFELQAHYLADQAERALDLIRLEWGFMLDDPRMTNSTFIEGYSTDGSLKYAPYSNDPRISHAHGWSTGPTAALTFYAAGLQITGAAGTTWRIAPQPGNLTEVDAGFTTDLGSFATSFQLTNDGKGYKEFSFTTPSGTQGDVKLAGVEGTLVSDSGRIKLVNGAATGVKGGSWKLETSK